MGGPAVVGVRWTEVDMKGKAKLGATWESDILPRSSAYGNIRVSKTTAYHHFAPYMKPYDLADPNHTRDSRKGKLKRLVPIDVKNSSSLTLQRLGVISHARHSLNYCIGSAGRCAVERYDRGRDGPNSKKLGWRTRDWALGASSPMEALGDTLEKGHES